MVMRLAVVLHSLRGHWSSHGASRWAAGGPRWHWWPPLEAKRRRTRGTPTVAWWGHGGRGSSHAWMHGVTCVGGGREKGFTQLYIITYSSTFQQGYQETNLLDIHKMYKCLCVPLDKYIKMFVYNTFFLSPKWTYQLQTVALN